MASEGKGAAPNALKNCVKATFPKDETPSFSEALSNDSSLAPLSPSIIVAAQCSTRYVPPSPTNIPQVGGDASVCSEDFQECEIEPPDPIAISLERVPSKMFRFKCRNCWQTCNRDRHLFICNPTCCDSLFCCIHCHKEWRKRKYY